ncbi:catalase [Puccinia graminis f. sp. tritici CRL 75-36-700-3]|uniref:Catalase n=1 Tax=Puccinia graminis f. sp. tritici (strain CRL 75-36-700-3 / race SCCL) TaxID=418459 RepID=E3JV15_PUCGT|nr:catalase [Puccinia graminis f. sp. tritici CRL 75-36-700-3]EFP75890.2 catalase [Puccinia graminis f. sp. tritici CRL 75-36-700-3]
MAEPSSPNEKLRPRQYPQTIFEAAMNNQIQASHLPAEALVYTAANGQAYATPLAAQRIGLDGPLLLQDSHLIDNQAHFNRKNIPNRVVHALGAGAHGIFTTTTDFASRYTMMSLFQRVGQTTPLTMRFSTAAGEKGDFDTVRNVRGFGVKFRTPKGNWDLTIRDPAKFPLLIKSLTTNAQTGRQDPDATFDYLSSNAEALPQFLRLQSDAEDSSSGHVYKWVKQDGSWVYVKITFKTRQGNSNYTAAEQASLGNPGQASQELFESIQAGQQPGWTVYAQVMTPQDAEKFRYNVLDLTKEWREDLVPLNEIGKVELTQNPTNYFAEVEQAAFTPSNIIDGWEPSDDPVLQMRLFAYTDAQRYRLGANYQQIPVNCPLSAVANYQRDGASSYLGDQGNRPAFDASYAHLAVVPRAYNTDNHTIWKSGAIHYLSQITPIDFEQPRYFYENLSPEQQKNLVSNFAGGLSQVKNQNVVQRVLQVVQQASPELAQKIYFAMSATRQTQ